MAKDLSVAELCTHLQAKKPVFVPQNYEDLYKKARKVAEIALPLADGKARASNSFFR